MFSFEDFLSHVQSQLKSGGEEDVTPSMHRNAIQNVSEQSLGSDVSSIPSCACAAQLRKCFLPFSTTPVLSDTTAGNAAISGHPHQDCLPSLFPFYFTGCLLSCHPPPGKGDATAVSIDWRKMVVNPLERLCELPPAEAVLVSSSRSVRENLEGEGSASRSNEETDCVISPSLSIYSEKEKDGVPWVERYTQMLPHAMENIQLLAKDVTSTIPPQATLHCAFAVGKEEEAGRHPEVLPQGFHGLRMKKTLSEGHTDSIDAKTGFVQRMTIVAWRWVAGLPSSSPTMLPPTSSILVKSGDEDGIFKEKWKKCWESTTRQLLRRVPLQWEEGIPTGATSTDDCHGARRSPLPLHSMEPSASFQPALSSPFSFFLHASWLLLLLFSADFSVQQWARSVLMDMIHNGPPSPASVLSSSPPSPAAIAARQLCWLCQLGVELLTVLRNAIFFISLPQMYAGRSVHPPTILACGMTHVWTVLTVLEERASVLSKKLVENTTPTTGSTIPSSSSVSGTRATSPPSPFSAFLLLASRLLFLWLYQLVVEETHRMRAKRGKEKENGRTGRSLAPFSLFYCDPIEEEMLTFVVTRINSLLEIDPVLPPSLCIAVKKTILKGLIHLLCDVTRRFPLPSFPVGTTASTDSSDDVEGPHRLQYVGYLWRVTSLLSPPPAPVNHRCSAPISAVNTAPASCGSLEWILVPLWRYAKQFFGFPQAIQEANKRFAEKSTAVDGMHCHRRFSASSSTVMHSTVSDGEGVVLRALYALFLLLSTLVGTVPAMMQSAVLYEAVVFESATTVVASHHTTSKEGEPTTVARLFLWSDVGNAWTDNGRSLGDLYDVILCTLLVYRHPLGSEFLKLLFQVGIDGDPEVQGMRQTRGDSAFESFLLYHHIPAWDRVFLSDEDGTRAAWKQTFPPRHVWWGNHTASIPLAVPSSSFFLTRIFPFLRSSSGIGSPLDPLLASPFASWNATWRSASVQQELWRDFPSLLRRTCSDVCSPALFFSLLQLVRLWVEPPPFSVGLLCGASNGCYPLSIPPGDLSCPPHSTSRTLSPSSSLLPQSGPTAASLSASTASFFFSLLEKCLVEVAEVLEKDATVFFASHRFVCASSKDGKEEEEEEDGLSAAFVLPLLRLSAALYFFAGPESPTVSSDAELAKRNRSGNGSPTAAPSSTAVERVMEPRNDMVVSAVPRFGKALLFFLLERTGSTPSASFSNVSLAQRLSPWRLPVDVLQCHAACWCWYEVLLRQPDIRQGGGLHLCGNAWQNGRSTGWREDRSASMGLFPLDNNAICTLARLQGKKWLVLLPHVLKNVHDRIEKENTAEDEKEEEEEYDRTRRSDSPTVPSLSFRSFSKEEEGSWAAPLCTVYHAAWICWWTVALMASQTSFSACERQQLLTYVADLPSLPPVSSVKERKRLTTFMKPVPSFLASASPTPPPVLSVEDWTFYTLCRHLYVALLVEHGRYAPSAFVPAFLHVAGHLSEVAVKVDTTLACTHKKWFVELLRYLMPPHIPIVTPSSGAVSGVHGCAGSTRNRPTTSPGLALLLRYAPGWLQEALTTAKTSLEVEHSIQQHQLEALSKRERQEEEKEEEEEKEKMERLYRAKKSADAWPFLSPSRTHPEGISDGRRVGGVGTTPAESSPPVAFPVRPLPSEAVVAEWNDSTSSPSFPSDGLPIGTVSALAEETYGPFPEERSTPAVKKRNTRDGEEYTDTAAPMVTRDVLPPNTDPEGVKKQGKTELSTESEVLYIESSCSDSGASRSSSTPRTRSSNSSSGSSGGVEIQGRDETAVRVEGEVSSGHSPFLEDGSVLMRASRSRSSSTDSLQNALHERKRRKVEVEESSRLSGWSSLSQSGPSARVCIPSLHPPDATHLAELATGIPLPGTTRTTLFPSAAHLSRLPEPHPSSSSAASSTAIPHTHTRVGQLLRPEDVVGGSTALPLTTGNTISVRHHAHTTLSTSSPSSSTLSRPSPPAGVRTSALAGVASPVLFQCQDYGTLLCYVAATTPLLSLSSASSSSSTPPAATLLYREILRQIPGCDSDTLPTIPLEFSRPSSDSSLSTTSHGTSFANHGSRSLYLSTFIPHIFVDLRFTVHRAVIAILEEGRLRSQRERPMQGNGSTANRYVPWGGKGGGNAIRRAGPLLSGNTTIHASLDEASASTGSSSSSFFSSASDASHSSYTNSVFPFIVRDALKCRSMARHASNPLDPSALRFSIEFTNESSFSPRQAAVLSCAPSVLSSFGLGEGDVVLVLLPLESVQHAMARRSENVTKEGGGPLVSSPLASLPTLWRELGGFPHICVVDVSSTRRSLVLRTYEEPVGKASTPPTSVRRTHTGKGSRSPPPLESRSPFLQSGTSSATAPISFVHVLHLAFTGKSATLYLFPLLPIRSYVFAIQSLHSLMAPSCPSNYPPLLLLPRTISPIAVRLQQVLEQYLNTPGVLPYVRSLLCERGALNEWQLKAVASCLFFIQPNWDALRLQQQSITGGVLSSAVPPTHYRPPVGHEKLPILIIEGPPGTGKTQTIGMLLENLLQYLPNDRRILVCAASNAAVDEVLLRLLSFSSSTIRGNSSAQPKSSLFGSPPSSDGRSGGCLVRVGVRDKIHTDVLTHPRQVLYLEDLIQLERSDRVSSLTRGVASSGGMKGGSTRSGTMAHDQAKSSLLQRARVIFSTLGSLHQLDGLRFHAVVVDEASQATEPDVVQALSLSTGRCVMVGDSKQLQPTVLCLDSAKKGMERSLLRRLLENGFPSILLRIQYRMHPDICRFPNEYVYRGVLSTDESVLERTKTKDSLAAKLGTTPRFVFINVPHGRMSVSHGTSRCNDAEARQLVRFMRTCREGLGLSIKEFGKECGIITFYQAQCAVIRRELFRDEREALTVATVDSYQGKEMSIILISCVRAPTKQKKNRKSSPSLGFLTDVGRVNVALTRARELCVVFGHQETFLSPSSQCKRSSEERDVLGENDAQQKRSESSGHTTEKTDAMTTFQKSSTMSAKEGTTSPLTAFPSLKEGDMLQQMLLSIMNR